VTVWVEFLAIRAHKAGDSYVVDLRVSGIGDASDDARANGAVGDFITYL